MKDIRFMSHREHVIWYNRYADSYMVAQGDGTDKFFSDWHDAMEWIDRIEDQKAAKKPQKTVK